MSVLIIADPNDPGVDSVLEWIEYLNIDYKIINFSHLLENLIIENQISSKNNIDNNFIKKTKFKSAWFRTDNFKIDTSTWPNEIKSTKIDTNLFWEQYMLKSFLYKDKLPNVNFWLSNYSTNYINKLEVLNTANQHSLDIPDTIITNNKDSLIQFKNKYDKIISKAAFENISVKLKDAAIKQYVELVDDEFIAKLPEKFFPSVFQEQVPKEYDLRVFYLDGKMYSIELFNNNLDYRSNYESIRYTPYKIPNPMRKKIKTFMDEIELNTGSLDFVKCKKTEKLFFLEVNPNGLFGNVSYHGNYYIEKQITELLNNYAKE